jgi:hypothetical protein
MLLPNYLITNHFLLESEQGGMTQTFDQKAMKLQFLGCVDK